MNFNKLVKTFVYNALEMEKNKYNVRSGVNEFSGLLNVLDLLCSALPVSSWLVSYVKRSC